MNLWFRLLFTVLLGGWKKAVGPLDTCVSPYRVWLTDLDLLFHVNNGRYFSLMDVARIDLMRRSDLFFAIHKAGWYPVVVAETASFYRSLKLFERFQIETTIIGWDERDFFLMLRFVRRNKVVMEAVVKARFLKRSGGSISSEQLRQLAKITTPSPAIADWIAAWSQAHEEQKSQLHS